MHAVLFSLKRVHQRALAYGRHILKHLPLTPARYDMLHAIDSEGPAGITQLALRKTLGVTAPTVTRMAQSLEALGLITREPLPGDLRQRIVRLTEAGIRRLRDAVYAAIGTGIINLLVLTAITLKWYGESGFTELLTFEDTLRFARAQLRDGATLHYHFHPDD
jgi:DNA-binding MarR family transcriptional regulator